MTIAAPFSRDRWRLRISPLLLTRFATVADQLLVAAANFWLTVSIGRAFPSEALAAYGIGLSAAFVFQALQRHTLIIPFMLQPRMRSLRRAGGMIGQQWIVIAATLLSGAIGILAA